MDSALIQKFHQINEMLKGARKVLVASHEHPDPDAVSSVLACHFVLKQRKIDSLPYLPGNLPKNVSYLPGFFEIKTDVGSFEPDLMLCLDYGDFKRLRLPERILNSGNIKIITIDHHPESDQRGEVKILEPKFSSTSEIIFHWLKYSGFEIGKELAGCFLTGIVSDSGGFRHVSTSSGTITAVSELMSKGISLQKIIRQTLAFNKPLDLSQAWGQVLSDAQLDQKTGLAYSWINFENFRDMEIKFADFDGITNLISAASPINLGLFLVEYDKGKIKGSLRSEPYKGKDVVGIARLLGGGGHPYAAGFYQEGTPQEVLKRVMGLIK